MIILQSLALDVVEPLCLELVLDLPAGTDQAKIPGYQLRVAQIHPPAESMPGLLQGAPYGSLCNSGLAPPVSTLL